MEMVEVDGIRIAYQRVGVGPPLVLLHGYVGDGPTSWRRQIEASRMISRWSCGMLRERVDPPIRPRTLAWRLRGLPGRIHRGLGLERPHVAGLSLVALSPSSSAVAILPCRRLWYWPRPTPGGPAPYLLRSPSSGSDKPAGCPFSRPASSWMRCSLRCSPRARRRRRRLVWLGHGGVAPGGPPRHGLGVGRRPAPVPLPRDPDTVGVRRPRRTNSLTVAEDLHADIPAPRCPCCRPPPCLQRRSPRRVQPGRSDLPPGPARLITPSL